MSESQSDLDACGAAESAGCLKCLCLAVLLRRIQGNHEVFSPIALGLGAARPTRRLRNDLTIDSKSERLEGQGKTNLDESITHRAHLLVAATEYPSLVSYEVALVAPRPRS